MNPVFCIEKLMEQSHSPTGHPVHASMAEEDADELKPLAPVTSSDPPPMSSSPRSGGDPDEETDGSKRLRNGAPLPSRSNLEIDSRARECESEIVSEPSSDQEQSNPLLVAGEGLPSGAETNGSHIVEIERDMEDELPRQSKKVLVRAEMIYKVPQITRSLDNDAYTPQFVSFGPYHHGTKALSSADKYKWFFLEQILNMNKEVPLTMYLVEMDREKQNVNACYQDIQMETNRYGTKMLLLDGCGILGFLGLLSLPLQQVEDQIQKQDKIVVEESVVRKFISRVNKMLARTIRKCLSGDKIIGEDVIRQEQDTVVDEASTVDEYLSGDKIIQDNFYEALVQALTSRSLLDSAIITNWHQDDLLLMENQLPFFVLQKIYGLATAGTTVAGSLTLEAKVDQTIEKLLPCYPLRTTTKKSFHHLLHCCHLKFKPAKANSFSSNSSSSNSKPTDELQPWRGATDLYKGGIKFKRKKCDPSESLLDVELVSGRTLMIPTLIIEDSTSSVFRNLIAFEQSCTRENYFVAYAFFMGELMSTPEDVTLLVKEGVVQNCIGADKEVSDFFNNLTKRVLFDVEGEHFLSSTFKELKNSYNSVGNKHIADLKQNYCRSPWLAISVVAAAIVLVCTIVQTVFAVIS